MQSIKQKESQFETQKALQIVTIKTKYKQWSMAILIDTEASSKKLIVLTNHIFIKKKKKKFSHFNVFLKVQNFINAIKMDILKKCNQI